LGGVGAGERVGGGSRCMGGERKGVDGNSSCL